MKLRLSFVFLAVAASAALRADFGVWLQNLVGGSPFDAVLFRNVNLPSGPVQLRRPPKETRPELARMPVTAEAMYLRAREAELQIDFVNAEADWKKYAEISPDKSSANVELADFYHRRLRPREELAALTAAGTAAAFSRAVSLVAMQGMPVESGVGVYLAWIAKFPKETAVRQQTFDYLLANERWSDAEAFLTVYQKTFAEDPSFPVIGKAKLEQKRGSLERALAVYDASFQPLWPAELIQAYFNVLKDTHSLRRYLESARAQAAARPVDIVPAARIFYYYQQQGNAGAAQRALLEFKQRKEARKAAWTAQELATLGELFEGLRNFDEAARCYYAMYTLPGSAEKALAALAGVLLTAPEQQIQFGTGDLSLYRDIATIDNNPGFLNGVLSLILNTSEPADRLAQQEQKAGAYFHRAKAAELITLFDGQFPNSALRAQLNARLIEAYAIHGESEGVLARGTKFLTAFPQSRERVTVTLLMADAYARKGRVAEELAAYESLLKDLGSSAPDHARVLDRAIARLVSLRRLPEALALFRRELDRNPNDPKLYEKLAGFLDQNKLTTEIEDVYQRAVQHFPDPSWHHKLARYYLRQKQAAKFEQMSREVIAVFSGTDIKRYFIETGGRGAMDAVLYRQLNVYAMQRFPHYLAFVKNLLTAYSSTGTADAAQYESLLRRYWYYDADLRNRYFEYLSRTGKLDAEIAALKADTPAATQLSAEAAIWKCKFEDAAPLLKTLAGDYPGDLQLLERTAAVHRSLGDAAGAIGYETQIAGASLRDRNAITRAGEIYADREEFAKAAPLWNRIAEIDPGNAGGYLEAATVFWDYYQYDDAQRLIAQGRARLRNQNLFAFEAAAILENKRDVARAIPEYIKGATQVAGYSPSWGRLIALARRPALRAAIEQATSTSDPTPAMFELRNAILESQGRRSEQEQYLTGVAGRASDTDLLSRVDRVAERQGFDKVSEASLRRQIALMTDPVERMRLTLSLVRLLEGRRDLPGATAAMQALYQGNPSSLGVVRAAVNFYWRTGSQARAIALLQDAAGRANAKLKAGFTLEAARKSIETGQYAAARQLLNGLLTADPFHAEYIAAMADSYAKQGDDRALTALYRDKLKAIEGSALAADDRKTRIAGMRRSLIPVLTRTKDFAGAVDQYIEIINRFPEDESVVREAAQYAAMNGRKEQISSYYARTMAASPRDARWPAVAAIAETVFENYPAAIDDYGKALQIRPDRTDYLIAKANLEERLMRFDNAFTSYSKLYDQTYRNPSWMQKMAETRARQGRSDDAVKHLKQALIEGRPQKAENYFSAAETLESWNMLAQARQMAEAGISLLTADSSREPAARLYGRLLARQRQYEAAYAKFPELQVIAETANIAALYYTPEEKVQLSSWLEGRRQKFSDDMLSGIAINAGLLDLSVKFRYQAAMANLKTPQGFNFIQTLIEQQRGRLRFDELGGQLEALWRAYPDDDQKPSLLDNAADAYQAAANFGAELRVLDLRNRTAALSGDRLDRYMELIAANNPQIVTSLTAGAPYLGEAFANFGIRRGNAELALRAINARGRTLTPAWNNANRALLGVYFQQPFAQVSSAFQAALADAPIGQRIGNPASRDAQLVGKEWFYFGARHGELLDRNQQQGAADYLPAAEEGSPFSAQPYMQLGDFYRERGKTNAARDEYVKALEIDGRRADAHNQIAVISFDGGDRTEAVARWKLALASLSAQQDQRGVPESFWQNTRGVLEAAAKRQSFGPLKEDADRLLRTYMRRNGTYRADDLLIGAMAAGGVDWVLDLSRAASNQAAVLSYLAHAQWMPDNQRDGLFRRMVQAAENKVAQSFGEERQMALTELGQYRMRWLEHLLKTKQFAQGTSVLASMDEDSRRNYSYELVPLEFKFAAQAGTLNALLERYAKAPENAPQAEQLKNIATDLRRMQLNEAARSVLEFSYQRELEANPAAATALLGLAEIRLEQNRPAEALAILRRVTLTMGEAFENHMAAAQLLLNHNRAAEALEFLAARVKAVPWDSQARQMLAEAQRNEAELMNIASSQQATYAVRLAAAKRLNKPGLKLGSGELELFAANQAQGAAAEGPLYFDARLAALAKTTDSAARFRLLGEAFAMGAPGSEYRAAYFRAAIAVNKTRTGLAILANHVYTIWDAPTDDQAKLATEYAAALKRSGQLSMAADLYRQANESSPNPAWKKEADDASQELARREANERRSPVITENIEQDRIVQPMLTQGGAQ